MTINQYGTNEKGDTMDKLSMEVAQALAANMSYGKWKAMQSRVEVKKTEEERKNKVYCKQCGNEIVEYKYADRVRFCSRRCREVSNYLAHYTPKRKKT